jgi:hypothetical protein
MEWFYYGERNDGSRLDEYPHNFDSLYLAKSGNTVEYDFLEIEFHWSGPAEDVQKSTKQLTIAVEKGTANTAALSGIPALLGY